MMNISVEEYSADEFYSKKECLLNKHFRSNSFYFPYSKTYVKVLLSCMEKSNHRLCKSVINYKMSTKQMWFYTFSRAKILIERKKGSNALEICIPHSLYNFKYMLLKELFLLDYDLAYLIKKYAKTKHKFMKFVATYTEYNELNSNMSFREYFLK